MSDIKLVKVRFIKEDESKYENWGFWTWYPGQTGEFVKFDYIDKEGAYAILELPSQVTEGELGIIVKQGEGWDNKATGDLKYEISELYILLVVEFTNGTSETAKYKVDLLK